MTHRLDLLDGRRVDGEHLLHADAVGQAADGDGLLDTAVLLGDDSALEDLDTLAGAFLDLHMHADGIAHQHLGHFLQLLLVQSLDEIHGFFPPDNIGVHAAMYAALASSEHRRQRTALFTP